MHVPCQSHLYCFRIAYQLSCHHMFTEQPEYQVTGNIPGKGSFARILMIEGNTVYAHCYSERGYAVWSFCGTLHYFNANFTQLPK